MNLLTGSVREFSDSTSQGRNIPYQDQVVTSRPVQTNEPVGLPREMKDLDRRGTDATDEFLEAIRQYQKESGRMFPTWSEVLEVAQQLGYRKNAQTVSQTVP